MKKLIGYLLALTVAVTLQSAKPQEKLNEGKATVEFKYPDASNISGRLLTVRERRGLTVYFKNGKSRAELKDVNNTTTIIDTKKKEIIGLWANAKLAIKSSIEEAQKMEETMFNDYGVKITDETKSIAGYECKKAIVTYKVYEKGSRTMDIWFTDAVASRNAVFHFKEIDGFIMGYSYDDVLYPKPEGVDFKEIMTCTKIEKEAVSDEIFKVPADYKVKTMEEMNKSMKVEYH